MRRSYVSCSFLILSNSRDFENKNDREHGARILVNADLVGTFA